MSRELNSTITNAITSDSLQVFFAVDLLFDSPNELYFWTGYGTKTINGTDYVGSGDVMTISSVGETSEVSAKGVTLNFSGIDDSNGSLFQAALTEAYQRRVCKIYFGISGSESDMIEIFTGYMDMLDINQSGQGVDIQLTVESKLVDLERPRWRKYTDAYQKSAYPGDEGMQYVASLTNSKLPWGKGGPSGTDVSGGSGGSGTTVGGNTGGDTHFS